MNTKANNLLYVQIISGDADLPVREELGDRRRKLEIQKTNKKIAMHDSDDHESNGRASSIEPEEDEFYKQAKLLKEAKQAAKDSKYSRSVKKLYCQTFVFLRLSASPAFLRARFVFSP